MAKLILLKNKMKHHHYHLQPLQPSCIIWMQDSNIGLDENHIIVFSLEDATWPIFDAKEGDCDIVTWINHLLDLWNVCAASTNHHYANDFATVCPFILAIMHGGHAPSYSGWTIVTHNICDLLWHNREQVWGRQVSH